MVCVCRPLQQPSLLHIPMGGNMFISRHDMRLTFTYCDPRVQYLIGYDPSYLIGQTVYQFHNPSDAHKCLDCHSILIKSGTGVSKYYRFLGRTGAWVWLQTKATIVSDTRGQPQYVVCNNYIVSQQEGERAHKMEQQQQHQPAALSSGGHPRLAASDVAVPGALELPFQVTSPVSSMEGDPEPHDDTGYSSTVSSASPSPAAANGTMRGRVCSSDLTLLHYVMPQPDSGISLSIDSESMVSSASPSLGFHSTLSSSLYGEDDLSEPISTIVEPYGPEPFTPGMMLGELSESVATPTMSDVQSDPFLCGGGVGNVTVSDSVQGQGRDNTGSMTNVMEDMELLEDLLEHIADCDSSQDNVFTSAPALFIGPVNKPSASAPSDTTVSGSLSPSPFDPEGPKATSEATQFGPQSLLRTLLDKEGEPIDQCSTPIVQAWAKSFPAVTLASENPSPSAAITANNGKGKTMDMIKKEAKKTFMGQGVAEGKQLVLCGDSMVILPRHMDLTSTDSSGEEDEKEEREVEEDCADSTLPPALPEDLLDFAMQYCESLSDMDTALPEGMTGLDSDMWSSTVDDFISPDGFGSHMSPSAGRQPDRDSSKSIETTLTKRAVGDSAQHKTRMVDKKEMVLLSGKMVGVTRDLSSPDVPLPLSPTPTSVIQSAIITSTRKDGRLPALTVSVRSVPGGGLKGVVITPHGKEKRATMLKYGGGVPSHAAGSGIKCVKLITPALSDHRYSSITPRTHSPHPPQTVGKRMRTDWDRSPNPGASTKDGKGPTLLHSVINSFPLPKISSSPSSLSYKGSYSPRSGSTSPCKSLSGSSEGSGGSGSQPTSPFPPPIPANGGGKPLSAMTELEKHLRGLVEPPDERLHDSDDSLPAMDDEQGGGRPFLQRLLTGEISHERYRQIDYHLLYQERERRLSENTQPPVFLTKPPSYIGFVAPTNGSCI